MARSLMKAVRDRRLLFSILPSVRTIDFFRRHATVDALSTAVSYFRRRPARRVRFFFAALTVAGQANGSD
jgi:hypothetical protein